MDALSQDCFDDRQSLLDRIFVGLDQRLHRHVQGQLVSEHRRPVARQVGQQDRHLIVVWLLDLKNNFFSGKMKEQIYHQMQISALSKKTKAYYFRISLLKLDILLFEI
jgi:hypothetical protein